MTSVRVTDIKGRALKVAQNRMRLSVLGGRGAIGLDILGAPAPGQFVVWGPGARKVMPFTAPAGPDDLVSLTSLAGDNGLAFSGFTPLVGPTRDAQGKLRETISITDNGCVGDGDFDNTSRINEIIDYLGAHGGGTCVVPVATESWLVEDSIEMKEGVHLVGLSKTGSFIQKPTTSKYSGTVNAAIVADSLLQVSIENLTVEGSRRLNGSGVIINDADCVPLWINRCGYVSVERVTLDRGFNGVQFINSFQIQTHQLRAMRMSEYGFKHIPNVDGGNTSCTHINPILFGCGGGIELGATVYSVIVAPNYELLSVGGSPLDSGPNTFNGEGGGDWENPLWMLDCGNAGTVYQVAGGSERCYAQIFRGEVSQVGLLGWYFTVCAAKSDDWTGFSLIGGDNEVSTVTIENLRNVDQIERLGESTSVFSVEAPGAQRFFISGRYRFNAWDEVDGAYKSTGMVIAGEQTALELTQTTMVVGNTALAHDAADTASVVFESGVKKLSIVSNSPATPSDFATFWLPIEAHEAFVRVEADYTYADAFSVSYIELCQTDGTTITALKTWELNGTATPLDERVYLMADSGKTLLFRIRANKHEDGDYLKFSRLRITYDVGQYSPLDDA